MKRYLPPAIAVILTLFAGASAFGQTPPNLQYYELQVAFCWGYYSALETLSKEIIPEACPPAVTPTQTYNCEKETKEDNDFQNQTTDLQQYLFTGTADQGMSTGVAVAIARGKKFAHDLIDSSLPLEEIKEKSAECASVIKELPY